jgi:hypothetical protein
LEQMLRIAMLAVALVAAVGATFAAQGQHRPTLFAARPAANLGPLSLMPPRSGPPIESAGRVEEWQNRRLVAAEAEAAAQAAAAQAAADATARAAARASAQAASAPPAATSIPSYPPGTVQDIITKAFTPLGATAVAWGLRVAKCESGYNPRAYNGAGPYYGLFQFLMSTFKATPFGGQDIYDPVANASAAAWKYSQGGAGSWGCR